jgi:hypothetical protein
MIRRIALLLFRHTDDHLFDYAQYEEEILRLRRQIEAVGGKIQQAHPAGMHQTPGFLVSILPCLVSVISVLQPPTPSHCPYFAA